MTPEDRKEMEMHVNNILHAREMERIHKKNEKLQTKFDVYTSLDFLIICLTIAIVGFLVGNAFGRFH
jgi:hypothetical protein